MMQRAQVGPRRPMLMTVWCVLGFIIISLIIFFSALNVIFFGLETSIYGYKHPKYDTFISGLIFVLVHLTLLIGIFAGYWQMKKWGFYIALGMVASLVFALSQSDFAGLILLLFLPTPIIGGFYFKKMS